LASQTVHSQWKFREEDEIVPGLTALTLLGGGLRYEAYLAWEERLRALVVAKVVRPDLVEDASTLAGLQREIELLERLNHPIIVRSFGGEAGGPRPHVVLEHLEGPRLSSLQRKHGPLLLEQLVGLAIEISSALHYLAMEGLVHLDVKPSNIIMGGPPRLIDLSVARAFDQLQRLRSPVGTDAYMAPEQAVVSTDELGPPADVWGLGATLHHALTGERPFRKGVRDSADPEERFPQLTDEPRELPRHVPPALAESIMSCLARDPAARPTAGELGDRLQVVLQSLPKPKLSSLKPRR
jgi:serine/threonine protein kinase